MSDQIARDNAAWLDNLRPLFEQFRTGTTGVLQSDGTYTDASAGLDAPYSWVTLDGNRSPTRVVNQSIFPRSTAGFTVETAMNTKTGLREITRTLLSTYSNFPADVVDGATMPGTPAITPTTNMEPGRVEPDSINGGLSIFVRSFQLANTTTFPLAAEDAYYVLTSEVAALSANTGAMALVYIDASDSKIHVATGTAHGTPYAYTQADADAITLPIGAVPLAALVLLAGQTDANDSFIPYTRYFDRRIWLRTYGLVLPLGSVSAPSLTFTGDLDTGLYWGSANTLAVAAGGVLVAQGDLSGTTRFWRVGDGLGTARLLFNGVTASTRDMIFQTAGTGRWIVRVNATSEGGSDAGSDFQLLARDDSGSGLFDNVITAKRSTGQVGIAVAPASIVAPLHVGGAVRFDGDVTLSGQAARTLASARMTTSNTAGNSLTIQAGGATSGATNKAGGDLVLQTGTNTGNVAPSHVRLMAGVMNPTSGTGDNSNVDRLRIGPTKVLTNNSAITIVNATLASNTMIGGIISYSIQVFDGTNVQTETGQAIYSGVNKAGAFTCSITEVNSQQDLSSGTLATTWAITGANPAAISVNANSSLTPSTGYPRITYNIQNFAQQTIAIA